MSQGLVPPPGTARAGDQAPALGRRDVGAAARQRMRDLVAQTGRYPQNAKGLDQFLVEGEQRCWVHVAIDRYTAPADAKSYREITDKTLCNKFVLERIEL